LPPLTTHYSTLTFIRMKRNCLFIFVALHLFIFSSAQNDEPDQVMMQKIREEGLNHSQVMSIAHYLTDVAGPRLTNSPGYIHASEWAVSTLKSWGLKNVRLEPWGIFGPGWTMEKCYVAMKAPYYHPIIAYPFAWTKGTAGLLNAEVVMISKLDVDSIRKYGELLKGKIILPHQSDTLLRSAFNAYATRYADSVLQNIPDTYMINAEELKGMMSMINNLRSAINLLQQMGSVALLNMNNGNRDGTVDASAWWSGKKGASPELLTLSMSPEDYLRIQRLVQSKIKVQLELDVQSKTNNEDENGKNVIAEIPGTDPLLKDEIVMIGAHLDSWYSGTGATDNGAGCAVMMEVMRILKTMNVQPRRTIRIALWSGEEQGLLGSYGYIRKHFGDPSTMKLLPDQSKVSAYYNLDNGTGKIRGIFLQNNQSAQPIFKKWFEPFTDLGATTVSISNTGSTDHFSFDAIGIPAFQFIQDPMEYETRTHHTNMDTYDHLSGEDLKQAAVIIAAFVYNTAMREEKLPRKSLPSPKPWLFDLFK
jgi:carboxypeptidase Q